MVKKRNISAHSDLKTGSLYKFFLIIGGILLFIYIISWLLSFNFINETIAGTILAFSILFIGSGIILYFFFCQFSKLSKIAEEVERGCESKNQEENK
jgi:hypothetical protein